MRNIILFFIICCSVVTHNTVLAEEVPSVVTVRDWQPGKRPGVWTTIIIEYEPERITRIELYLKKRRAVIFARHDCDDGRTSEGFVWNAGELLGAHMTCGKQMRVSDAPHNIERIIRPFPEEVEQALKNMSKDTHWL